MSDKRNSITGMPTKKVDERTELNILTGVSQDVKEDDSVSKSDEKIWPSISDIDKRDEDAAEQEQDSERVSKSSDEHPFPSLTAHLVGDGSESGEFSKTIPIFTVEKKGDEQIVCGIVYEPNTVDAQGDQANAEEIEKAANYFMENAQQVFKVNHKGKPAKVKVLQSYIAPQDLTIGKKKVKKGSWVLVTKILDKKLWEDIKSGTYTGYSMAGYARVD